MSRAGFDCQVDLYISRQYILDQILCLPFLLYQLRYNDNAFTSRSKYPSLPLEYIKYSITYGASDLTIHGYLDANWEEIGTIESQQSDSSSS